MFFLDKTKNKIEETYIDVCSLLESSFIVEKDIQKLEGDFDKLKIDLTSIR